MLCVITDYEYNKLPDAKERAALGQAIGLSARAVQVWFQNRRQRQKPSNEKAVTQWVEMDESKRLISQGMGIGATPTQADVMGADNAMPLQGLSKSEAADAIVAAIQKQAATLSYSIPDHVQMERERALASAVAHAKAVHETGAAQERALGAASAPFLGETPTTEPRPLPDMSLGFTQPRMDAAQLLSLDAQSQQLELRAALLDAYAKRERAPTKNLSAAHHTNNTFEINHGLDAHCVCVRVFAVPSTRYSLPAMPAMPAMPSLPPVQTSLHALPSLPDYGRAAAAQTPAAMQRLLMPLPLSAMGAQSGSPPAPLA